MTGLTQGQRETYAAKGVLHPVRVMSEVRQPDMARDYAMLVRGKDAHQGWINVAAPTCLFEPAALKLYDEVLAAQSAVLAAGAAQGVSLYGVPQ